MTSQLITIVATFTADLVEEPISFWINRLKLTAEIALTPYNQVFQQLLDPTSIMARNQKGVNFLLVRLEDWLIDREQPESIANLSTRFDQLRRNVRDFTGALEVAATRFISPIVVCICPPSTHLLESAQIKEIFAEMATIITNSVAKISICHLITETDIQQKYATNDYYDGQSDKLGHIPYNSLYFTALGTILARKAYALSSTTAEAVHKVLVLDCDNTLWKGICGEDGALGVEINEHRQALQKFVLALQQRGMIICLCSKNNLEDVFEVFDKHPQMILQRNDIVAWQINWQPKSENLQALAQQLNLGLDSFIFIDDSVMECAEVRARTPQVLTLLLPYNDYEIPSFLNNIWVFDRQSSNLQGGTAEDRQRTLLYKQEIERHQLRKDSLTLDQFLKDLNLQIDITPLQSEHFERAAQLTKRTNQFNFTSIRRGETELKELINKEALQGLMVEVNDRFGSYGLVGLILFKLQAEALVIDTFLLSCRALGRGVEHQMLIKLAQIATMSNLANININFVENAKNKPAREFLTSLGLKLANVVDLNTDPSFSLPVSSLLNLRYAPNANEISPTMEEDNPPEDKSLSVSTNVIVLSWDEIARSLATANQIHQAIAVIRQATASVTISKSSAAINASREAINKSPELINENLAKPALTAIEKELVEMWKDLLALEEVGLNDDFFELGGHSLRLTQLLSRVNDLYSVEITINDVFDWPTISAMAKLIEERRQVQDKFKLPAIPRSKREGIIPLAPNQLRSWLFAQTNPKKAISQYLCLSIHIIGRPRPDLLTRTLNEIMRRHEILRTTFPILQGKPAQKIIEQAKLVMPHIDLSHLAAATAQSKLQEQIDTEAQTKIDLMKDLPLRAKLIQTKADEFYLLVTFHHIIFDGWSRRVFFQEFTAIYQAFYEQKASPLPALPIQFADYVIWQQEFIQSAQLDTHLDYWRQQLQTLKVPDLAVLRRSANSQKQDAFLERLNIDLDLLNRLHILSHTYRVTLYMTLLAAVKTLFYYYANQGDIIIAAVSANRNRIELEGMIGLFANTLPLRTNLDGDPTFAQVLQRVKESTLQAFAHQDVPIEVLVNRLLNKNDQAILGQIVMFNLQTVVKSKAVLPEFHIENVENLKHGVSRLPLAIHALETDTGLLMGAAFDESIYDGAKIVKLLADYKTLLEKVVENAEQPLSQLRPSFFA